MAREFEFRFRRRIAGVFAGDAAPSGALVVNDPSTGIGTQFNMALTRRRDQPSERPQGYWAPALAGFAGTLTLQLWIVGSGSGVTTQWVQVGTPLAAVPGLRLFEATGWIIDANTFIQVTPSVPMIAGEGLDLFLEEIDE